MQTRTPLRRLIPRFALLVPVATCLMWWTSCARKKEPREEEPSERAKPGARAPVAAGIPEFWPPPKYSASADIPREFLRETTGEMFLLGEVERRIREALLFCGYSRRSYFAVPDGFAMVTRLEQINPDGTPKEEPYRWATDVPPPRRILEILRGIFTTRPGYYRVIVFIVTPHPFSESDVTVSREDSEAWLRGGLNRLPDSIAAHPCSEGHICTALIYEFEQSDAGGTAELRKDGRLSGMTHLTKAGLWEALSS